MEKAVRISWSEKENNVVACFNCTENKIIDAEMNIKSVRLTYVLIQIILVKHFP